MDSIGSDDSYQINYSDDFFSFDDGLNPCIHQPSYYNYLQSEYLKNGAPTYDYIVLNDNTRTPSRYETRDKSLDALEEAYLPLIVDLGAVPIFIHTYAYSTPYRDMTGLEDIAEFTSFTYAGYKEYVKLLSDSLPDYQMPKIAPVGLVFLLVYEENYDLWLRLFHVDMIHCSPLGTLLQGIVLHHTLYGSLPKLSTVVRGDLFNLWVRARRFQPEGHRRMPFPTEDEAAYLYNVAAKVVVHKKMPQSFIDYENGEGIDHEPADDAYRVDDLFR